jgi:hypothetical protein
MMSLTMMSREPPDWMIEANSGQRHLTTCKTLYCCGKLTLPVQQALIWPRKKRWKISVIGSIWPKRQTGTFLSRFFFYFGTLRYDADHPRGQEKDKTCAKAGKSNNANEWRNCNLSKRGQ